MITDVTNKVENASYERESTLVLLGLMSADPFSIPSMQIGINFDKYNDIPIDVVGMGPDPPQLTGFEVDSLPSFLRNNLRRVGYEKPTPIQRYGIPVSVAGHDLMSCAQTGSGKTAAFLIPTIARLHAAGRSMRLRDYAPGRGCPSVIILSPTRELAQQINTEACKFAYQSGISVVCVVGGVQIRQNISEIKRGCDILIGTPGRVIDLIRTREVTMQNIRICILDEADRMLEMGFDEQIEEIMKHSDMPTDRQTLMFSATFPPSIRRCAVEYLRNDYISINAGVVGAATANVTQHVVYVRESEKQQRLLQILREYQGLQLVFVRTRNTASDLWQFLEDNRFCPVVIHGDLPQDSREANLTSFRSGEAPVLVATDVAQRGLDIPNVVHVINYDMPAQIEDYVHRIGRTGRCGNTGIATSFVTDQDYSIVPDLVAKLRESKHEVPSWLENIGSGRNMRGMGAGKRKGGQS